jgi:hypothetical protein
LEEDDKELNDIKKENESSIKEIKASKQKYNEDKSVEKSISSIYNNKNKSATQGRQEINKGKK